MAAEQRMEKLPDRTDAAVWPRGMHRVCARHGASARGASMVFFCFNTSRQNENPPNKERINAPAINLSGLPASFTSIRGFRPYKHVFSIEIFLPMSNIISYFFNFSSEMRLDLPADFLRPFSIVCNGKRRSCR